MGKRKKKKKIIPAQAAISKHEDIALKVTAQFFKDEILPALNIGGEVVEILSTESIYLQLKLAYEDFNYLMADGSIAHFEFQSTDGGVKDLRRFRTYEAVTSYQYQTEVTTYVLYSGTIKNPVTELTEGINTYRVHPIIMQDKNADETIKGLRAKIEAGERLEKGDFLPLIFSPLMSGTLSQKERIVEAYGIVRDAKDVDDEVIQKVEAVLYIMADKFLDSVEMEQLKEEIKLTKLGQMLYHDGFKEGEARGMERGMERGIERGIERGEELGQQKMGKLIMILLQNHMEKDIEIVSSDKEAREEYYKRYGIE